MCAQVRPRITISGVTRCTGRVACSHATFFVCRPPVVHRDIKPDNIVLANSGADCDASTSGNDAVATARLVDFGGVQDVLADGDAGSFGTTVVGTAGFTPPEQFGGAASAASDMYALGGVVLYLLSGRSPGSFGSARLRVAWEDKVEVTGPLQALLRGALEPIAEDRPTARQARIHSELTR